MTVQHLCYSGSPACSGCNPCVACAEKIHERVLPAATVAAGLNGSLLALVHVFAQTLHQVEQRFRIGVDPANLALSQAGVPLTTVFAKPEDQVHAFMAAYREAWGRFLQSMAADPAVVRTLIPEGAPLPANQLSEEQIQEMMRAQAAAGMVSEAEPLPQPPPAAPPSPSAAGPVAAPATTANYEAFIRGRTEAAAASPPPSADASLSVPLAAEDVAAAALPVDPAMLPNGALHGQS